MEEIKEVKRATAGFVISLIAGILILINGAVLIWLSTAIETFTGFMPQMSMGIEEAAEAMRTVGMTMGVIGLVLGIIVLIGAVLVYTPGKEVIGGVLVLIVSIISIVVGGGFMIGLILGIIGGVLGIARSSLPLYYQVDARKKLCIQNLRSLFYLLVCS